MEIILINTPRNVRAIRGLTASLTSQNSLPIRKTQQRQQSHGVTPGCCCDQYIRFFLWFCFFVTFFDFYLFNGCPRKWMLDIKYIKDIKD